MTRFSKLTRGRDGSLAEANIHTFRQADMLKCPFAIMLIEHYRSDGSCRCNDPDDKNMKYWGYRWNKRKNRWTTPKQA